MNRKYCLVLATILFIAFSVDSKAQEIKTNPNSVLVSPFGLVSGNYKKLRLRYQHETDLKFVYGMDFKYFFNDEYPGFQFLPFIKVSSHVRERDFFYFYLTVLYGMNKNLPVDKSAYHDCYGGGAGGGYQVAFGEKKRMILDLALGLKYVESVAGFEGNFVSDEYDDYFIVGPASFFDGIIGLGYKF